MGLILDLPRVDLHMPPDLGLDDDVFFAICRSELIAKMHDYQANGVRLGWLILPMRREVYRFAGQAPLECLEDPDSQCDEEILPGLTLDLAGIWSAGS